MTTPAPTTIPSYPTPGRALDGSETLAGWQDGAQRAISVDDFMLASERAGISEALASAVAHETMRATDAEAQLLPRSGGAMTGPIDMGGQHVFDIRYPESGGDVANAQYVADLINALFHIVGGVMIAQRPIDMGGQHVFDIRYPESGGDVANAQYVIDLVNALFHIVGGAMIAQHPIDMGGQHVFNVRSPESDGDVPDVLFVTDAIAAAKAALEVRLGSVEGALPGKANETSLADESARATAAEDALDGAINAEAIRAEGVEATLDGRLDAVEPRAADYADRFRDTTTPGAATITRKRRLYDSHDPAGSTFRGMTTRDVDAEGSSETDRRGRLLEGHGVHESHLRGATVRDVSEAGKWETDRRGRMLEGHDAHATTVRGATARDVAATGAWRTDRRGRLLGVDGARETALRGTTVRDVGAAGAWQTDRRGRLLGGHGARDATLGGLAVRNILGPEAAITDRRGRVLLWLSPAPADPVDAQPLMPKLLCGVAGVPLTLEVPALLSQRSDAGRLDVTLAATSGFATFSRTSSRTIDVDTTALGATAELRLREPASEVVTALPITVATAPNPAPAGASFNLLLNGDSIANWQGAYQIGHFLAGWNYAPNFIGTVHGSGAGNDFNGDDGLLGETRPGWTTGNETGADPAPYRFEGNGTFSPHTPNPGIIVPGGEAGYLASGRDADGLLIRRYVNPALRVATAGDAAAIVRNGLVLDYSFYQSRFSLPTPDIVIYALGTNDAFFYAETDVYARVYADDMLVLARMRAAWPSAKILRVLPGTSAQASRASIWTYRYAPMIRAMLAAQRDLGDANIHLVPTWAMMPDTGYALAGAAPDPLTGTATSQVSDPIHPIGATRARYHQAVAAAVACAARNLI